MGIERETDELEDDSAERLRVLGNIEENVLAALFVSLAAARAEKGGGTHLGHALSGGQSTTEDGGHSSDGRAEKRKKGGNGN